MVLSSSRIVGFPMTTKDKAISLIRTLNDDVSLDEVIDGLYLLRKIELGIAQADDSDVLEHDVFMNELESDSNSG